MIKVKFDLRKALHKLEQKTGKRYTTGDIAFGGGGLISRQSVFRMISQPDVELSSISMLALSALLAFFHAEGMHIKLEDLFDVTYPDVSGDG